MFMLSQTIHKRVKNNYAGKISTITILCLVKEGVLLLTVQLVDWYAMKIYIVGKAQPPALNLMSPSAGPEEIQLLQKLEEANRLDTYYRGKIARGTIEFFKLTKMKRLQWKPVEECNNSVFIMFGLKRWSATFHYQCSVL